MARQTWHDLTVSDHILGSGQGESASLVTLLGQGLLQHCLGEDDKVCQLTAGNRCYLCHINAQMVDRVDWIRRDCPKPIDLTALIQNA